MYIILIHVGAYLLSPPKDNLLILFDTDVSSNQLSKE